MMSVLFMIGRGMEQADIIDYLFDVDKVQERPNYAMAPGENLILSDCGFEDVKWENQVYADYETFSNFRVSNYAPNNQCLFRPNLKKAP